MSLSHRPILPSLVPSILPLVADVLLYLLLCYGSHECMNFWSFKGPVVPIATVISPSLGALSLMRTLPYHSGPEQKSPFSFCCLLRRLFLILLLPTLLEYLTSSTCLLPVFTCKHLFFPGPPVPSSQCLHLPSYDVNPKNCRDFLIQCTILFEFQTFHFPFSSAASSLLELYQSNSTEDQYAF